MSSSGDCSLLIVDVWCELVQGRRISVTYTVSTFTSRHLSNVVQCAGDATVSSTYLLRCMESSLVAEPTSGLVNSSFRVSRVLTVGPCVRLASGTLVRHASAEGGRQEMQKLEGANDKDGRNVQARYWIVRHLMARLCLVRVHKSPHIVFSATFTQYSPDRRGHRSDKRSVELLDRWRETRRQLTSSKDWVCVVSGSEQGARHASRKVFQETFWLISVAGFVKCAWTKKAATRSEMVRMNASGRYRQAPSTSRLAGIKAEITRPRPTHRGICNTNFPCIRLPSEWVHLSQSCGHLVSQMSPNIPKKTFTVSLSPTKTTDITITESDLRADNLNLTTWTSSFVLANQLHKLDVRFEKHDDIPVLELGAGTGLVGLTAAALWRQRVILTDLPGIVPGLRTNVDLNLPALRNASTDVRCGSLDWKDANTLRLETGELYHASSSGAGGKQKKATVILAADTIYDEEHPELLSNAIFTWLAKSESARVVLCYPLRVAYLDQIREIWTVLEEGGLVVEKEGQERADSGEWDDECLCEWVVWRWRELSG